LISSTSPIDTTAAAVATAEWILATDVKF
jgi:hypothetical protein